MKSLFSTKHNLINKILLADLNGLLYLIQYQNKLKI